MASTAQRRRLSARDWANAAVDAIAAGGIGKYPWNHWPANWA